MQVRSQEVSRRSAAPDSIRLAEPGTRHGTHGKPDIFEDILDIYQRKAAQRMLEDFESNGVDEDLEALRAGWASNFKSRPGRAPPRQPLLADITGQEVDEEEDDYFLEPRSVLAAQGQRAQQRLHGLQQLRRLASGEKFSYSAADPGGRLLAAFPGPLAPPSAPSAPSRPARPTALKSKPAQPAQRDPWAEWETRWSEEFRRFEDMERLRQRRSYEAQYAEEREREAEWHRRVQAEKERAADQSAKNSYRKPQQQQQQRRTPDPPKKEPKSTGWLPPRAPQPEPAAKASAGRSFASFAEFAAAWQAFEQRLSSGSQKGLLTAVEIPWPHSLPSVSGVLASDATADIKKKLRTALIRWHPDKWAPILEHVVEAQRGDVLSRVKEVTQRLLEEKKMFDAK
eukprot:s580_g12.t1